MHITVWFDRDELRPELSYLCQLLSSILDARFVARRIGEPCEEGTIPIAYCSEQGLRSLDGRCQIRIVPDQVFWDHYLRGEKAPLCLKSGWAQPVVGSGDAPPGEETAGDTLMITADLLVSAFCLVTRYEELDNGGALDTHGRFLAERSVVRDWVDRPLVNLYARELADRIGRCHGARPGMRHGRPVAVISHDIDIPFYYGRPRCELSELKNSLGRASKYRTWGDFGRYLGFLAGVSPDPYDTFDYFCQVEKRQGIKSTYFILLSDENPWGLDLGRYAKSLRTLAAAGHEIALHPGYDAVADPVRIRQQKQHLERLIGAEVRGARHHFLRFRVPESYQALADAGLSYDSSLGYAEKHGFRAGICTPFRPYDLRRRQPIDLWEIPLMVMDGTLRDYLSLSPDGSWNTIQQLIDTTSAHSGALIVNWHNSFLTPDVPLWRKVFEDSLAYLVEQSFEFMTCAGLAARYRSCCQ